MVPAVSPDEQEQQEEEDEGDDELTIVTQNEEGELLVYNICHWHGGLTVGNSNVVTQDYNDQRDGHKQGTQWQRR